MNLQTAVADQSSCLLHNANNSINMCQSNEIKHNVTNNISNQDSLGKLIDDLGINASGEDLFLYNFDQSNSILHIQPQFVHPCSIPSTEAIRSGLFQNLINIYLYFYMY